MIISFSGLALSILILSSTSTSISIDPAKSDEASLHQSFHDEVYARDAIEAANSTSLSQPGLRKRGMFNIDPAVKPNDASYIQQAFFDLRILVNYIADNLSQPALNRYFAPQHHADVARVFDTVRRMAADGGIPGSGRRPSRAPYDLKDIRIPRSKDLFASTLAEAINSEASNVKKKIITIYDFAWGALWKRSRNQLRCGSDIGPKTNYKMDFLGALLLHEVLHFEVVPQTAWQNDVSVLDDQPGIWACKYPKVMPDLKAYGPYEAIQLLQRNPGLAKVNIDNYVWYALETYWMNECRGVPGALNDQGVLTAPKNNDILHECKSYFKGYLSNIWC